jgi:hypothetical protein
MKKFIALALGLVLVGTTVMVTSEASRDAYHTHLYQQALKKRGARRFAEGQKVRTSKKKIIPHNRRRPLIQNTRYSKNKRNLFTGNRKENQNLKFRPMSKTIGFATARSPREVLKLKNLDPMFLRTQTIVTEDFSLELPRGWKPNVNEGILQVGDNKSFEITAQRITDVCENVSFKACAITLSKNLNHLENVGEKITSRGRITRLSQKTDRILGTNVYTDTYTESFIGTYLGRDVFVIRYFVQEPETNNVFLIQTIVDRELASEAVVVAKRLEKSFRMIAQ